MPEREPQQLGLCEFCGGGVWEDMPRVSLRSLVYHLGCAERLRDDLAEVLA